MWVAKRHVTGRREQTMNVATRVSETPTKEVESTDKSDRDAGRHSAGKTTLVRPKGGRKFRKKPWSVLVCRKGRRWLLDVEHREADIRFLIIRLSGRYKSLFVFQFRGLDFSPLFHIWEAVGYNFTAKWIACCHYCWWFTLLPEGGRNALWYWRLWSFTCLFIFRTIICMRHYLT